MAYDHAGMPKRPLTMALLRACPRVQHAQRSNAPGLPASDTLEERRGILGLSKPSPAKGERVHQEQRDPVWHRRREPFNQPLPATARWVESFPEAVRPIQLFEQFPRIANTLARVWNDPARLRIELEGLLVDRRPGRRGFPPEVYNELLTLRDFAEGRFPATTSPP